MDFPGRRKERIRTVKKPQTGGGDGRTSLAAITGSVGVNRTGLPICRTGSPPLTSNCFSIESISAVVAFAGFCLTGGWKAIG